MDSIKEAFQKVKGDMDSLKEEINLLRTNLNEINQKLSEVLSKKEEKNSDLTQDNASFIPTHNPTNPAIPTHNPTDNIPFKPLKAQNMILSTGNSGVPTDRQTDRQTDQHIKNMPSNQQNPKYTLKTASDILDSLDSIKKEIRLMFKGITEQEMLVFSTIYQMDEELGSCDYRTLAIKLKLTESSIRDYTGRLIKKGIPVDKIKINNKNIKLSISPNLKKITSLPTILKLREL